MIIVVLHLLKDLGLQAFLNLFSDEDRLSVGGSINLSVYNRSHREFTSIKNVEGFLQDLNQNGNRTGDITMPFEMALGFGYAPVRLYKFFHRRTNTKLG